MQMMRSEMERSEEMFASVPEVLPNDAWHDGWGGAAGAEVRDGWYEPYPHRWDQTLLWCRLRYAMCTTGDIGEAFGPSDRSIDKLPGWVIRRALPYVRKSYR